MTSTQLNDQQTAERLKSLELTKRDANSLSGRFIYWGGALFALAHIYFNTLGTLSELWVAAIHFAGFALICALMVPMSRKAGDSKLMLGLDLLIGLAAVGTTAYLMLFEDALYARGVNFITTDWIVSIIAIAIALELTRRTTGWFIPCLILFALTYVFWWGQYVPGHVQLSGPELGNRAVPEFFLVRGDVWFHRHDLLDLCVHVYSVRCLFGEIRCR